MVNESKIKKQKLGVLVREINIPKEDIIKYLNSIGIDKITINTTLEPNVVEKVYLYFKRNIEEKDKHLKRVKEFSDKVGVDFSEVEKKKKQEEEEKKIREEQERIRKNLEEEIKRKEAERKKQELQAIIEKEKKEEAKKQREKQEKMLLEKMLEDQRRKKEETKKAKEKKLKGKTEEQAEVKSKIAEKETASKVEKPKKIEIKEKEEPVKTEQKLTSPQRKEKQAVKAEERIKSAEQIKQEEKSGLKQGIKQKSEISSEEKKSEASDKSRYKQEVSKTVKSRFERYPIRDIRTDRKKSAKSFPKPGIRKERTDKAKITDPVTPAISSKVTLKSDVEKREKLRKLKNEIEVERKKKHRLKSQKVREPSKQEIEEAIRDTFAKIEEDAGASARTLARKRKRKERMELEQKKQEIAEARKNIIEVTEYLSANELANLMGVDTNEVIAKCFGLGLMITINQRLDKDTIILLADEFGFKVEFKDQFETEVLKDIEDDEKSLKPRPPVVTVMGHVDHGKTSLLDYIRKTNVVAGEAGGITQHIGAYKVELESGKSISFLDTPGHEAFTAMRARGGQASDIVVLVVAADDSVMPQTVEAINHALAANVKIIVAINKIDKPDANTDRIRQQLAEKNILVEEWGGKYQCVEISAKFGKNIEELLNKILTEAEMLQLTANPDRNTRGVVLESKLDKGKGIVATVLVQKGTLRVGDVFISGIYAGKVKAMFDERDNKIEKASPSSAAQVLGFDGMPQAGDTFIVLDNESEAKSVANKRQQLKREQELNQYRLKTLEDISKQIKEGKQIELNIIIKADTDGSSEALSDSLHKLSTDEAKVRVIHKALGQIVESDVLLAEASNALIIGFNVRPNLNARKLAEKSNVDIRVYNIIYNAIDEIKNALEGMLEPEVTEEITSTIEVRQLFKVPKVGVVAGCYVQDGKFARNSKVRLLRDGLEIYNGNIISLKRHKDDVREVEAGYECGIALENFNDIKVGDIIEAYKTIEIKRKLNFNQGKKT